MLSYKADVKVWLLMHLATKYDFIVCTAGLDSWLGEAEHKVGAKLDNILLDLVVYLIIRCNTPSAQEFITLYNLYLLFLKTYWHWSRLAARSRSVFYHILSLILCEVLLFSLQEDNSLSLVLALCFWVSLDNRRVWIYHIDFIMEITAVCLFFQLHNK